MRRTAASLATLTVLISGCGALPATSATTQAGDAASFTPSGNLTSATTEAPPSPSLPGATPTETPDDAPTPSLNEASSGAGDSVLVAGAAMVLGKAGHFTLCTGMILSSLPPAGCGGPALDLGRFDPATLPGYYEYGGAGGTVTTEPVGIVGWWNGKVLRVAKIVDPSAVPPSGMREPSMLDTACATPGGAAVPRPRVDPSMGPIAVDGAVAHEAEAVLAYAEAQPDLAMVWYSENAYVVNAAFTGDVDKHKAAMRAVYRGPLCVVTAKYTDKELRRVQDQLARKATGADGRPLLVESAAVSLDRVDIRVMYATDADIAAIRAATLPEVYVHNSLAVVAADSPLAAGIK